MDHFRSLKDQENEEEEAAAVDMRGECPACQQLLEWSLLTQHRGTEKASRKRKGAGRRKRGKKKARVATATPTESDEIRSTRPEKSNAAPEVSAKEREREDRGDAVSIDAASSNNNLAAEYNSDGWFEEDRELDYANDANENHFEDTEEGDSWEGRRSQNILGVEKLRKSSCTVDMIDLTEE